MESQVTDIVDCIEALYPHCQIVLEVVDHSSNHLEKKEGGLDAVNNFNLQAWRREAKSARYCYNY